MAHEVEATLASGAKPTVRRIATGNTTWWQRRGERPHASDPAISRVERVSPTTTSSQTWPPHSRSRLWSLSTSTAPRAGLSGFDASNASGWR